MRAPFYLPRSRKRAATTGAALRSAEIGTFLFAQGASCYL